MKKKIAKALIKAGCKAALGVAVAGCIVKINNDRKKLKEYEQLVKDQQRIIRYLQELTGTSTVME